MAKTHEKMLTIYGHKGNANQNHTRFHLISVRTPKTPPTTNVGEDVGKKEPPNTAGGNAS
jgi:hypothetical protein